MPFVDISAESRYLCLEPTIYICAGIVGLGKLTFVDAADTLSSVEVYFFFIDPTSSCTGALVVLVTSLGSINEDSGLPFVIVVEGSGSKCAVMLGCTPSYDMP